MTKSLQHLLFLTILFLVMFNNVSGQSNSELIRFGDEAYNEGDYYGASLYYKKVLDDRKNDIELTFKYAESCRLFNSYIDAESSYAQIISSDTIGKFPIARFWHAVMVKNNGKYLLASRDFKDYYLRNKNNQDYYTMRAYHEIEACKFAIRLMNDTVPVNIQHLDAKINSIYSESGAVQVGDSVLFFSSMRPESEDNYNSVIENSVLSKIYFSRFLASGLSTGEEFSSKINSGSENTANIAFNSTKDEVYVSRCRFDHDNRYSCRIYRSKKEKGKWQPAIPLNAKINLKGFTSTQPSIGYSDGKEVLYFSSDRKGGYGNMDIWYALQNGDDFDEPKNAGGSINTPGDDITPFYYQPTGTLYFSSDWHNGLGGMDIFFNKGNLDKWGKVENAGFPLNSSYNDMYYTVNGKDTSGTEGYFTSNRPGSFYIKGETCCNDIFSFKKLIKEPVKVIPVFIDTLRIEQSIRELLPLTLYFHNDEPDAATDKIITRKNYQRTVYDYLKMTITYKNEYGKGLNDSLKVLAEAEIDTFFNKYVKGGFDKLEKFTQLLLRDLQRGNNVKITIKGFTSPLNTQLYNINLAKRRISSLKNYFNEYVNGVFIPYLEGRSKDGGRLALYEDPIGKTLANPNVSDDPNDTRNSVFSPAAGLERRIQIILYSSGTKDTIVGNALTEASFNIETYDFGNIPIGEKTGYTFNVVNTGKEKLYITSAEADNPLVKLDWSRSAINPGSNGIVNVLINEPDKTGKLRSSISLYMNVKEGKRTLSIRANVTGADQLNMKQEGQEKNPRNKIKKEK